jgi:hypothetical protein
MKESGFITIGDPGSDKAISVTPTVKCIHCGGMWEVKPGSGRVRGWCTKCNGPVCGPGCAACVPFERQLENVEAGKSANTPGPIRVSVPRGLWLPSNA